MRKQDRAYKLKGWRRVPLTTEGAVRTESTIESKDGNMTRVLRRGWVKDNHNTKPEGGGHAKHTS
jgi:hypothetical protein